jgi:hypothetical protein
MPPGIVGTPYALPEGTHDGLPLQERQAWTQGEDTMLTIHITETGPAAGAAATPRNLESLAVCLARHGVPPDVVQTVLAALAHVKALRLCRPSEEEAWEIQATAS